MDLRAMMTLEIQNNGRNDCYYHPCSGGTRDAEKDKIAYLAWLEQRDAEDFLMSYNYVHSVLENMD